MNKEHIILADVCVWENVILKRKGTCPCFLTLHTSSLSSYNCFVIQDLVDTLIPHHVGFQLLTRMRHRLPLCHGTLISLPFCQFLFSLGSHLLPRPSFRVAVFFTDLLNVTPWVLILHSSPRPLHLLLFHLSVTSKSHIYIFSSEHSPESKFCNSIAYQRQADPPIKTLSPSALQSTWLYVTYLHGYCDLIVQCRNLGMNPGVFPSSTLQQLNESSRIYFLCLHCFSNPPVFFSSCTTPI